MSSHGHGDEDDWSGITASDTSLGFEVTLRDDYLKEHDPASWLRTAKMWSALVIAQALVDELEVSQDKRDEPITDSRRDAIFASSALLAEELEIAQVRDGSVVVIVIGTAASILHWLSTIGPVISAVSTGLSIGKLAKRVIDRVRNKPSQPSTDLEWMRTLPKGSVVVVEEPGGRKITIEIG